MRKVHLNMKELEIYNTIKKLVDTNGNKKNASVKIGCTVRHINRLIIKYNTEGKSGFIHKNRGKAPPNKYSEKIKRKIINKFIKDYSDANIVHFSELVYEDEHIKISPETIRLWLIEEKIISTKTHRITKNRIKKRCKEELKKSKTKKQSNILKQKIEEMDKTKVHPRRPRCKYFGEMVQMDASEKEWIKGVVWHLHLAIDDATGRVLGAYFDTQETLNGYYHVLAQILTNYGIPALFYTDKRTVFEYKRKVRAFDDEDTFTQFSYCCHKLGIQIKTTSVAEAKGRIERLNETFQSRLPIELRRANVASIEEANEFLKSYLEKYNNQFALQLNITSSVFEAQPNESDINNYLSVLSERTVDRGHTIKFKNKVYIPSKKDGSSICLQEGMKVLMIETFDNRLLINAFDNLFYAKEIKPHEDYSKEFDQEETDKVLEYAWVLPRKTPWRQDDFLGFLAKQKHRPEYNQNLC